MKKLILLLLAGILLSAGSEKPAVRIHILGDSTTEQQNQNLKDQRGWPQLLPDFFTDEVVVLNHGKSGASSRTYYEQRWWKNARETILPGDYVVIQFGHNDEKHQGVDGPIGTVANGSYREYLQKFVDEVRELGAIPIFTTPIVRKMEGPGQNVSRRKAHDLAQHVATTINEQVDANDTVSFNYPHNMRQIAAANHAVLIDMTRSTEALINRIGYDAATRRIYNFGDDTHICAEAALLFSRLFVEELKSKDILTDHIIDNPPLVVQPASVDLGEVAVGAEQRQQIDLIVPDQSAGFTGFHVEAGRGVLVSDREFGDYVGALDLPAGFDLLYYRRVYLKIAPTAEGTFSSHVTVSANGQTREIPVKSIARPYPRGEQVVVSYSLNGNEKPVARGPVLAIEHTLGGLERSSFNALGAGGLGAHLDPPITSRAEWLTLPGKQPWPQDEIDLAPERYAQFGVGAAPGTTLWLERLVVHAGGGANYRIQIATDPSFIDYSVLAEGGGEPLTRHAIAVNRSLKAGQTLYLRVYPWSGGDTDAQLCLSNIRFEGRVDFDH